MYVACADPLYVGAGAPLPAPRGGAPLPWREGHTFPKAVVGGVRSAGGWQRERRFSWDAPPYAGDRDASPTVGGGTTQKIVKLVMISHDCVFMSL